MLGFIFGPPGTGELLLLAAIGLLIFGKRLPEVGKNLGKAIIEFKKGLSGVEDDLNKAASKPSQSLNASSSGPGKLPPPPHDAEESPSPNTPQQHK